MDVRERYQWIDSLKGISILGVIMIHSGATGVGGIIGAVGKYGSSFVQAFLVISAFLAWKTLESSDSNGQWLMARMTKLAPVYYVAIVIYLIVTGGSTYDSGDINPKSFFNVICHFLFLHGFFPKTCNNLMGEWYLGVLVIFYFLAPIIHRFVNSLLRAALFFAILNIGCNYICRFFLNSYADDPYAYIYQNYFSSYGIWPQFPTMALGIVLYYIVLRIKSRPDTIQSRAIALSYASLLLTLVVLKAYGYLPIGNPLIVTVPTLYGVAFSIYMIGQCYHPIILFNNKAFKFVGMHSWEMYIFHPLYIYIYNHVFKAEHSVMAWLVKYFLILTISILTSILIKTIMRSLNKPIKA